MDENKYPLNQSVDQRVMNMDSTPYIYDILPNDSIRILSLLPGDRSAPLQCELHRADVPSLISPADAGGPAFEALSYTWGDGKLCQRLFCNDSAIKITQSLYEALIHLRHPEATRTLWVDAVCIDQNNNDEKIEQLPHMKDIYQYANQVVIWLGLADESTGQALSLIRLAAHCLRQESGQSMPTHKSPRFQEPFSDERNRQRGFPPKEHSESWLPVVELFARSWFYRCWTFQEAALAMKATIQIGAHLLDWADLCLASTFFYEKSYTLVSKEIGDTLSNICGLCWTSRIGKGLQEWRPMPLMVLLIATSNTQATLAKDRIFGLLALTDESTQKYFSPSGSLDNPKYNMSMRELCTDVSLFLHHYQGSRLIHHPLGVLNYVKHYPLEEGEQEKRSLEDGGLIPSWVQRWHYPVPKTKIRYEENEVQPMFAIFEVMRFRAGGLGFHTPESNPRTPYEISLHGFIFATISNTVNFLRLPPLSRSRLWDLILEIRSVREERHTPYPTGESIDEAFALTLTLARQPLFTHGAETYHAIDFQHLCVSLYELTIAFLEGEGRIDDVERLRTEWEPEYQRLKSLVGTHVDPLQVAAFLRMLQECCLGGKLFSTFSGHIGIGGVTLEPGDLVCVFLGGRTPFIIRPVDQKYKFVGDCYLHGIMQGEALEEGLQRRQLITLI